MLPIQAVKVAFVTELIKCISVVHLASNTSKPLILCMKSSGFISLQLLKCYKVQISLSHSPACFPVFSWSILLCWHVADCSGVDLSSCPEARLIWHLSHDLRWILERSQVTLTNPLLLHTGWKSSLSKDLWEADATCGWSLTTPYCLEHVLTYETWGLSDGNAIISQECCQSYMLPYRFLNLEQSFGEKYSDRFLNGIWCSS